MERKQIEEVAPDFFKKKISVMKFYITEKCNLDCDFCLYKDRGVQEREISDIKKLIDLLDVSRLRLLILSGGEPTMRWELLREVIAYVRLSFSGEIVVQTNGTLLNAEKIDYFVQHNISVEFGFDGTLVSMMHHRININENSYQRVLDAIKLCREKNINCWATMVVPPQQAAHLVSNFQTLLDAGIPRADISPAIYEKWDDASCGIMKKEFVKLMDKLAKEGKVKSISNYINTPVRKDEWMLVVTADLGVSLNYMNMCFPQDQRKYHNFLHYTGGDWLLDKDVLEAYVKRYAELFSREELLFKHILFYFGVLANQELQKRAGNLFWANYVGVENFLAQTKKLFYLKSSQSD